MNRSINYPAILVCTIVSMLVGMFWYSPLAFGDVWAQAGHFQAEQLGPTPWHFVGAAAVSLIIAWGVAQILARANPETIGASITMGLIIWLGFIATTHFSGVIWANKPFVIYLIDAGCLLVYILINSIILQLWQKSAA